MAAETFTTAVQGLLDAITNGFSVTNIVGVLTAIVTAGITFVFFWWGLRMAFRGLMGAVKNGYISLSSGRRRRR